MHLYSNCMSQLTDPFVVVELDSLDCPSPADNDNDVIIHVYICTYIYILVVTLFVTANI